MALILQQIDEPTSTVLTDFNGVPQGGSGPGFLVIGDIDFGTIATEVTLLSQPPAPGAIAAVSWAPPTKVVFPLRAIVPDNYDDMSLLVQQLQLALDSGGPFKVQVDGSSRAYIMDVLPSATPQLIGGTPWGYLFVVKYLQSVDGMPIELVRQPYFRAFTPLLASVNVLQNATLLEDNATGQPSLYVWDDRTGLSADTVDYANQAYSFVAASTTVHKLQQTYGTAAPGDTWTLAFDAWASDGVTARAAAVIEYLKADNTVLGTSTITFTTLNPTTIQRLAVTFATAPALTAKVRAGLRINNTGATAVTIWFRRAQLEKAAAATDFRVGIETVTNDITQPFGGRLFVYNPGPVSALVKATVVPTAGQLVGLRLSRDSIPPMKPVWSLVRNTTLASETVQAADGGATGGQTAVTTPAVAGANLKRWRWVITGMAAGTYNVNVTVRVAAGALFAVSGRAATFNDGVSAPLAFPTQNLGDLGATSAEYQVVKLGTVRLSQQSTLVIEGWASLLSTVGDTLKWDRVTLNSADEFTMFGARSDLYAAAQTDMFLGSTLVSPPTDPGGLGAGTLTAQSSILVLKNINDAGGTPPDAGIVYPAGTHQVTYVVSIFVVGAPVTQVIGICRVWNRTNHSAATTTSVLFHHGQGEWQQYQVPITFQSDGVSAYQFQVVKTHDPGSQSQIDVKEIDHSFTPALSGAAVIVDGVKRQPYISGVNAGDVAANLVLTGGFFELAPNSTALVMVDLLDTPASSVGQPDPALPSTQFVPGRTATVAFDITPRYKMP